jgi:predicted DNA binding CopG/RHH family protein
VRDSGERGKYIMKRTNDKNMPVGKLTRVKDFLPPPNALAPTEENVKITISLKRSSVEFFRQEAHKHHTKYQKMIRELLDQYASHYQAAG